MYIFEISKRANNNDIFGKKIEISLAQTIFEYIIKRLHAYVYVF